MPYSHQQFEYTTKDELELKLIVDFYIIPEDKGLWRYSNGDPGYPPSPAELIIEEVRYKKSGEIIEDCLFNFFQNDIESECWNLQEQLYEL